MLNGSSGTILNLSFNGYPADRHKQLESSSNIDLIWSMRCLEVTYTEGTEQLKLVKFYFNFFIRICVF